MTRSSRLPLRFAALLGSAAIIAACTRHDGVAERAPASEAPASAAPSASAGAFEGMAYPATGEAPCGEAAAPDAEHDVYKGNFKKISAVDA